MDIEEMQKFWDNENQQILYTINEEAMQKIIEKKRRSAISRVSKVEKIFILVNIIVAAFLYFVTSLKGAFTYSMIILISFHILTVMYVFYFRQTRLNNAEDYGTTMKEHLDEAIYHADKQSKLSKLALTWYIIIAGALSVSNFIELQLPWYYSVILGLFFVFAYFAGIYEQRYYHDKKRNDLIKIREKIISN